MLPGNHCARAIDASFHAVNENRPVSDGLDLPYWPEPPWRWSGGLKASSGATLPSDKTPLQKFRENLADPTG